MSTTAIIAAAIATAAVAVLTVVRLAAPRRLRLPDYCRACALMLFVATGALGGGGQIIAAAVAGGAAVVCAVAAARVERPQPGRNPNPS